MRKVAAAVDAPNGLVARVRRVGYVPMPHFSYHTPSEDLEGVGQLPGLVPDPLLPESEVEAGQYETNAFWISVDVPVGLKPGRYPVTVSLSSEGGEPVTLAGTVIAHRAVLEPRRDFPVTRWFYPDALCDWYKTEVWQESFWRILDPYLSNYVAHGQDTILTPAFTPPLDGVKRPTQLLGVAREGGRYSFDWSLLRRWIRAARSHGIGRFEWSHLLTQWGAQHAIRIYEGHGESGVLLWPPDTLATSATYRDFLSQYLSELKRFLVGERLLRTSFFHLSDEPYVEHLANYRAARGMLRELAPWMTVMDAISQIEFAREGLTDIPIPCVQVAPEFLREGFPAWHYVVGDHSGRYLDFLLDTPLSKIRMSGWLFYKNRARGFLHWGYNYWYRSQTAELIDPYQVSDGLWWPRWPYGDCFIVYPGATGPVDSIRWEVWRESLQDYALLQNTATDPDDLMLAEIKDYADFPRSGSWISSRRRSLLSKLDRLHR